MAEAADSEDGNRDESAAIVIRREKKKRRGGEEERDDNESAVGNISCRTLWNLQLRLRVFAPHAALPFCADIHTCSRDQIKTPFLFRSC